VAPERLVELVGHLSWTELEAIDNTLRIPLQPD